MTRHDTDALSAAHTQRHMDAIPQTQPTPPEAGELISRKPGRWIVDNGAEFEKIRQNFTTTLLIHGPNMTLPEMSERLCWMRDEINRLSALPAAQPEGQGAVADDSAQMITMTYRNYRGEVGSRDVIPSRIWWGSTEWHPEPGWLMTALDLEKGANRDFALTDCQFIYLGLGSTPAPASAGDLDALLLLRRLELANDAVCGARPQAVYDAMIAAGMSDRLLDLDDARRDARDLLALRATAEPVTGGVMVKPLVWVVDDEDPDCITAGDYDIYHEGHGYQVYFWSIVTGEPCRTLADAKAFAWQHHEARIRAALIPTPTEGNGEVTP